MCVDKVPRTGLHNGQKADQLQHKISNRLFTISPNSGHVVSEDKILHRQGVTAAIAVMVVLMETSPRN